MQILQDSGSEIEVRRQKILSLKSVGEIPFKDSFQRTSTIHEARGLLGARVAIAGRVVAKRVMGKFGFAQIGDIEDKIQISVAVNELGQDNYDFYKKTVDMGDFIGVFGEVYTTNTGEVTVRAERVTLLSKALRPLPEKFHGLVDMEAKYKQRYLDIITNEETRRVFLGRSQVVKFIRCYLENNGFVEVETPILQSTVSGASARPFYTKHNALNKMCNLRIAPEIYLKQTIAAGFDRVFELGKVFRNEGMDQQHLQEFTMLEWYASYWNFEDNIKFYTKFIKEMFLEVLGTTTIEYEGKTLDFGNENWPRINYTEEMGKLLGFDYLNITDVDEFIDKVERAGLYKKSEFDGIKTVGGVIDYIYKRKIRVNIIQPTILYNYPGCLIPLARKNDKDPRLIDAFQAIAVGIELAKAYSELVDPITQRQEFESQAKAKAGGDEEAMDIDEDFLLAMEHGMPPISGLGFGIDRLVKVMFNQPSLRDVVLYPIMK